MSKVIAAQRWEKLSAECARQGWPVLLVYGNAWRADYLRYATDFPILEGHGVAVIEGSRVRLFLDSPGEAERAQVECEVEVVHAPDLFAAVAKAVAPHAGKPLATVPAKHWPAALASLPATVDVTSDFDQLLMRKTPAEIDAVRRASALADDGYEIFCRACRPGRREYEVVTEMEAWFRSRGCPDNFMIMASGGQEVRSMHPPGDRALQVGDLVTTELTPCVDGYYAQICRTLVIGPPSPAQTQAVAIYVEAMEAGIAAVRPGVKASEIARIENDVFRRHGLGEYTTNQYTRVRGHGLGLYVDSRPAILEDVDTPLADGMTVIVHPNTYNPHVGYIVLGDAVVVRDSGTEVLTRTPRRLISVPA